MERIIEQKSKHPGDVANWIEKVINSSTDPQHDIVSRKLIRQFDITYADTLSKENLFFYHKRLRDTLDRKCYGSTTEFVEED